MHNPIGDNVEIHIDQLPFQQIPNWILESNISAQAIRLYLYFQKYGNNKTKVSFWSRKKMAKEMNVSPATMDRAKKELIEIGALCQINRFTEDENWTSNMYHVHWDMNTDCKVLIPKAIKSDDTPTACDEPPILIDDELTNNHLELRTKELSTRTYGAEVNSMANLLADLIKANGINRPDVTDKWLADIERLNRIDGYSWEQIESTIRWVQADSFWRSNVLSPSKLRKQFGALQLKMKSSGGGLSGWARVIAKFENDEKELGQ